MMGDVDADESDKTIIIKKKLIRKVYKLFCYCEKHYTFNIPRNALPA